MARGEYQPEPHVAMTIPDSMKSKKFSPQDLPVGTPVFYRGERYHVETVPPSWDVSAHVRIANCRIRPEFPAPNDRVVFAVHPDLLEIAPVGKNPYGKQPTHRSVVAKAERQAKGVNDAGDVVADLLRGSDLDTVYAMAAEFLSESEDELRAKAGHLNPGQQRMWCGNRMRNWLKKNGGIT